nr:MAG TPA: head closure knob [Caudoviricetes sp.]
MRLKKNRLKAYNMRKFQVIKTDEGIKREGYSDETIEIKAEIWPASGRLQAEIYGERLNYILNANVEKSTAIAEKDGLCVDKIDQVTHRVISIKEYSNHKVLELERVRSNRS